MPHILACSQDPDRPIDRPGRQPAEPTGPVQPVPLSIWACAQRPTAPHRRGRYLLGSTAHRATMWSELAVTYNRPGELVLDPKCGIVTSEVRAIGLVFRIEGDSCSAELVHPNLGNLRGQGTFAAGGAFTGDVMNADTSVTDLPVVGKVVLRTSNLPARVWAAVQDSDRESAPRFVAPLCGITNGRSLTPASDFPIREVRKVPLVDGISALDLGRRVERACGGRADSEGARWRSHARWWTAASPGAAR